MAVFIIVTTLIFGFLAWIWSHAGALDRCLKFTFAVLTIYGVVLIVEHSLLPSFWVEPVVMEQQ